mmetsp:Transcript_113209/g.316318  ORF Transcript_113209/g.316318 Transcript_113209/m.316318 type:complete len:344 (-) Transcript_113209:342-1373(-)
MLDAAGRRHVHELCGLRPHQVCERRPRVAGCSGLDALRVEAQARPRRRGAGEVGRRVGGDVREAGHGHERQLAPEPHRHAALEGEPSQERPPERQGRVADEVVAHGAGAVAEPQHGGHALEGGAEPRGGVDGQQHPVPGLRRGGCGGQPPKHRGGAATREALRDADLVRRNDALDGELVLVCLRPGRQAAAASLHRGRHREHRHQHGFGFCSRPPVRDREHQRLHSHAAVHRSVYSSPGGSNDHGCDKLDAASEDGATHQRRWWPAVAGGFDAGGGEPSWSVVVRRSRHASADDDSELNDSLAAGGGHALHAAEPTASEFDCNLFTGLTAPGGSEDYFAGAAS